MNNYLKGAKNFISYFELCLCSAEFLPVVFINSSFYMFFFMSLLLNLWKKCNVVIIADIGKNKYIDTNMEIFVWI